MKKNFFYRVEPGMLLSEIVAMDTTERGVWITQVAVDLQNSSAEDAKTSFGKKLITESNAFRNKRRESGKLGGLAKASTAKAKASKHLPNSSSSNKENKPSGFQPPTPDEVRAYCLERGKGVNPQRWYDFYESKGWMIGKNKMKSWKAAVRTWEKVEEPSTGTSYEQY